MRRDKTARTDAWPSEQPGAKLTAVCGKAPISLFLYP